VYFAPPLKRLVLELGIGAGGKKTRMIGLLAEKKFDGIFSRVDTPNETYGQTDEHRATAKTAFTHSVGVFFFPARTCQAYTEQLFVT